MSRNDSIGMFTGYWQSNITRADAPSSGYIDILLFAISGRGKERESKTKCFCAFIDNHIVNPALHGIQIIAITTLNTSKFFIWSLCTLWPLSCPRTRRVWPAPLEAAASPQSAPLCWWQWSVCCTEPVGTLLLRSSQTGRSQRRSWCSWLCLKSPCPDEPVMADGSGCWFIWNLEKRQGSLERTHLFQNFVDVHGIRLSSFSLSFRLFISGTLPLLFRNIISHFSNCVKCFNSDSI